MVSSPLFGVGTSPPPVCAQLCPSCCQKKFAIHEMNRERYHKRCLARGCLASSSERQSFRGCPELDGWRHRKSAPSPLSPQTWLDVCAEERHHSICTLASNSQEEKSGNLSVLTAGAQLQIWRFAPSAISNGDTRLEGSALGVNCWHLVPPLPSL